MLQFSPGERVQVAGALNSRPHHAVASDEVVASLGSRRRGLNAVEVQVRTASHGPNVLPPAKRDGPLVLLWRQINNPLIWVLITSSIVAVLLGKVVDGAVVLGVVVVNTLIGFVQELRASQAIEALRQMVPENATVTRAGSKTTISAAELVPGDIVHLASGDKVPADLRLLAERTLKIEEAALTGESVPAEKGVAPLPADAELGDRRNMAYSGTLVTYGTGTGVVVTTGAKTELGRISGMLREATDLLTPLTRQMASVAKWLTTGILVVSVVLMVVGLWRGYPLSDAMLAAVTLAVAAIPEGLPAIITIALAIGVRRMARRKAIIRKLPAVETLGGTTVICSDKTGTLTRNEMTVQALWTPADGGKRWTVAGIGYEPKGEVRGEDGAALRDDALELLRGGALANDAALRHEAGRWTIAGDPTEGAMLVAAEKAGLGQGQLLEAQPKLDAIPFESERQYMATLHGGESGTWTYVKGAPEAILSRCSDSLDRNAVHAEVEFLASRGMRVLAVARKRLGDEVRQIAERDVEQGLELLGLEGMIDPPRSEAIDAVATCRTAGICVKMITGDHALTAASIGRQLGLLSVGDRAVTGAELAQISDEQLREVARTNHVFARVAPEHKLRLVRALQARGEVVAMTGDGVNDAPALKQADIGVAMGITGTAVSKESADMVLTDDNFASIASAVEEGRRVYDNIIKSLAFVLPTNLGLALILMSAVVLFPEVNGVPLLPMEPVQILWINLVATVALALPLAFEAMEPDVMRRRPRQPDAPVLGRFVVVRTVLVGLLMALGGVGLFLYEYWMEEPRVGHELAALEAQTMAVTTVILFQVFYVLNCRSLRESIMKIGLFSNPAVYGGIAALLLLQAAFIYVPFMNAIFGSAPLAVSEVAKAALAAAVVLPLISLEKWVRNRSWAVSR